MKLTWKSLKEQINKLAKEQQIKLKIFEPQLIDSNYGDVIEQILLLPLEVNDQKTYATIPHKMFKRKNSTFVFEGTDIFVILGSINSKITVIAK